MIPMALWGIETEAQELAHQMVHALPVTAVSVALWDSPNFSLRVKGFSTLRPVSTISPVGMRISLSAAKWHRYVFEERQAVTLHLGAPVGTGTEEAALGLVPGLRSVSLVPVALAGESLGVLSIGEMRSPERASLTREKLDRCEVHLEKFLAVSHRAWEVRRLVEQARAMSHLLQISSALLGATSFDDILALLTSGVSDWFEAPVKGLLFAEAPSGGMTITARRNLPEAVTEEEGARLLLALARATDGQFPVSVLNVADDPLDPLQGTSEAGEVWTRICLPLMEEDQIFGLACLYVGDGLLAVPRVLEVLRRIGEVVGVAMETVIALQRRERA
jgi:hypothetical protein